MTGLHAVAAWCRAHPWVLDVPVAAAVFLISVFRRPPEGSDQMLALTGPGTLLVVGLACLLLVARSRFPVTVWVLVLALAVGNISVVGGPSPILLSATVGIYTVAVRKGPRVSVPAAVASAVLLTLSLVLAGSLPLLDPVAYAVVSWCGLAAALGVAVRSRRAVLMAAEERAVRAEQGRDEEAQRRVAEERLRIARELHDVLAHHISVINVQAGVARHLLAHDPAAAAESMEHVREASQLVLSEMPMILGVLRTDEERSETVPAPGLDQMEHLVESMRRAGLEVSWHVSGRPLTLSPTTDLTAYRLLQEALTNARKHGLGRADMSVAYEGDRVVLTVQNPVTGAVGDLDGAGQGLVGMRERVGAVGGQLRVISGDAGMFVVRAELSSMTVG